MEIISYGRDGALSHRDSLGNTRRIVAGDFQVMSAAAVFSTPSSILSRKRRMPRRAPSSRPGQVLVWRQRIL
jgi:Pirin